MKYRLSTDLSLTFHYAQVAEDRGAGKPCKACPAEALQGNYGFCRDHRKVMLTNLDPPAIIGRARCLGNWLCVLTHPRSATIFAFGYYLALYCTQPGRVTHFNRRH